MSLVIGARRHLEWGHEKYIMDTIQSHPAQVDNSYFSCDIYFIISFRTKYRFPYGCFFFYSPHARANFIPLLIT